MDGYLLALECLFWVSCLELYTLTLKKWKVLLIAQQKIVD